MAKDPAVLWYWNDWQGGTMTLTRHQKGCYIDLLNAQFNSGPLSLEQIKTVLGTDQANWTVLSKKFKKVVDTSGNEVFFNERMEAEKYKRVAFIKRQAENGAKGGRPKNPSQNPWVNPDETLSISSSSSNIKASGEKKDGGKPPTNPLDLRKKKFYDKVAAFKNQYPKEMLREFYDYWVEANLSGKKLRFEQENAFELPRRLRTWASKDKQFGKTSTESPKKIIIK